MKLEIRQLSLPLEEFTLEAIRYSQRAHRNFWTIRLGQNVVARSHRRVAKTADRTNHV